MCAFGVMANGIQQEDQLGPMLFAMVLHGTIASNRNP